MATNAIACFFAILLESNSIVAHILRVFDN